MIVVWIDNCFRRNRRDDVCSLSRDVEKRYGERSVGLCCVPVIAAPHLAAHGAWRTERQRHLHHLHYLILGIAFIEEALGGPGTRNPITELTIRQKAEPSVNVSTVPATPMMRNDTHA